MGKKLLIDKSKRNLLIFSDFMKYEEPALYKILLENNKIDEDTAEKLSIKQIIKQNLPAWLTFQVKSGFPIKVTLYLQLRKVVINTVNYVINQLNFNIKSRIKKMVWKFLSVEIA